MKRNSKILVFILAFSLLIGSAFCFAATADEEPAKKLTVISQNVEYSDTLYLYYAVYPENVDTEGLKLEIYTSNPTGEATPVATVTESTEVTITDTDSTEYVCRAFKSPGIALKDMSAQLYVKAVALDGTESSVRRYSVVEYFNEMSFTTEDESKSAAYRDMLKAGDAAQLILNHYPNEDANDYASNYKYVTVTDGTLADGFDRGVYLTGTSVTLNYTGSDNTVKGWTVENLENGELTFVAKDSATFALNAHLRITPNTTGTTFIFGTGKYYSDSAVTSAHRFDFSENNSSSSGNATGNATKTLVDGIMKLEKTFATEAEGTWYGGDNLVADSVYTAMTNPCLVFESDIMFEGFDNVSTGNLMVRFDGLGKCNRFYLRSENSKIYIDRTNLCFDSGTWYNLRMEIYATGDSTTPYVAKVYVNDEYVGTKNNMTTESVGNPSFRARWYMTSAATANPSNIYMDNVFYGYVDKAYVAGQ